MIEQALNRSLPSRCLAPLAASLLELLIGINFRCKGPAAAAFASRLVRKDCAHSLQRRIYSWIRRFCMHVQEFAHCKMRAPASSRSLNQTTLVRSTLCSLRCNFIAVQQHAVRHRRLRKAVGGCSGTRPHWYASCLKRNDGTASYAAPVRAHQSHCDLGRRYAP